MTMHRERRIQYDVVAQGQLAGIKISAPSLQRIFIDSALATSDYRIPLDLVKEVSKQTVTVTGSNLEALLLNWLNATALLFTEQKFLPYRIVFNQFDGKKIEAVLTGETYESARHGYPRPFTEIAAPFSIGESTEQDGHFLVCFYLR
jgi:SHS2 domain-containing protein